jgi:hypothetical protein
MNAALITTSDCSQQERQQARALLISAEAKAIAEPDEWSKHDKAIPHEQVLPEFGLSMADWEKMSREP